MPLVDFSSVEAVVVLISDKPRPKNAMTLAVAKSAVLFFFAVIVQVTIVSSIGILGGSPDLVLVLLVAVSLSTGSIFGAISGFWAGLVLDVAQLGTLGFTSLLLTLAGFWIGRYGETTGRDRAHAPLLSVAVVTVLYAVGSLILHYLLREPASADVALVHVLPGDRPAEPPARLPRLRPRPAALPPAGRAPGGRVRWLAAQAVPARALPAARPARRGPVPAHAADRLPDRRPRLPRPHGVRRPLLPALGPPGALREPVPPGGREQPAPPPPPGGAAWADQGPVRPRPRRQQGRDRDQDLAGRPPEARAATRRCGASPRILNVPLGRRHERDREAPRDPVTPVTVKQFATRERGLLPPRAPDGVPGHRRSRTRYVRQYPYGDLAAQLMGYVGEINDDQLKQLRGYSLGDKIGQGGIESSFDKVLRGQTGLNQLRVDSLGRPTSPVEVKENPHPGLRDPADARREAPAGVPAGGHRRHQPRAGEQAVVRERRARSSRSTRVTARSARSRPTRATTRTSSRPARSATARAAARPERGRGGGLPGAEPRDRGRLSARLDVQAGDRARRDAGAHPRRRTTRSSAPAASSSTGTRSTTGTRTRTRR